jgi:hypothetical protein
VNDLWIQIGLGIAAAAFSVLLGIGKHTYTDFKQQFGKAVEDLTRKIDENSKIMQANTLAHSSLAASMALQTERHESFKRESELNLDGIRRELQNHNERLTGHEKELRSLRENSHEIRTALNHLVGLAQINERKKL